MLRIALLLGVLVASAASADVRDERFSVADILSSPFPTEIVAARGADALITDEPALAVSVLREFDQLEPTERLLIQLADLFDRPGLYGDQ